MKASKKHPVILVREKTLDVECCSEDTNIGRLLKIYEDAKIEFTVFCNKSYEAVDELKQELDEMDLKECSYLKTKFKKKNPRISLRQLQSQNCLFHDIVREYAVLQEKVLNSEEQFIAMYKKTEINNRMDLKKFYNDNPRLLNMTYLTNQMIYDKANQYLKGKYDEEQRNLRKIEFPLLKIATKATTKASPLWYHNKVSAISDIIPDFQFSIKSPLITPNYVFFHRIFEQLVFKESNLPYVEFKVSKKFSISGGIIYLFRNDVDNYKIHRAKDVLVKIPVNPIFEKMIEYKDMAIDSDFVCKEFGVTYDQAFKLIKKTFEIGLLTLMTELDEGFDMLGNLRKFVDELPVNDYNRGLIEHLTRLEIAFEVINEGMHIEAVEQIYAAYDDISNYIGIDNIDNKMKLYGDYIADNPSLLLDNKNVFMSEKMSELLSVFPMFDINQMIKHEFIHRLKKLTKKDYIELNHPMLMQILTDVNLQYGSYWLAPWSEYKTESVKNNAIFKLKKKFVDWLREHKDESVVDIEKIIQELSEDIKVEDLGTEGYYTLFYQKEEDKTIINKVYPGFGSFYQRFLRYTDILQQYEKDIDEFYNDDKWRYVEILETLGFNANVTETPYFKGRYRDIDSKGDYYNKYFKTLYDDTDAQIQVSGNELYIAYPNGDKVKPVIASSLVRALYPGRLAFISSLFTNISFIVDMAVLFLNWQGGPIKITPRIIYKDIILERKGWLIDTSLFNELSDADEYKQYRNVRGFIVMNVGENFYYHLRKTDNENISSIATEFLKPQYCDINNILHYKLLMNSIKETKQVFFRESVPKDYSLPEYAQEVYTNGN